MNLQVHYVAVNVTYGDIITKLCQQGHSQLTSNERGCIISPCKPGSLYITGILLGITGSDHHVQLHPCKKPPETPLLLAK